MAELRTPQGHTLLLPEGRIAVGADLSNEVPVAAHFGLAPVHFRLQPWEGGHFIEDAGSGLGTLVNGHPVNWKPLIHGDIITAGELELSYSKENSPVLAQKAPPGPVAMPQPPPVIPSPPPEAVPLPVLPQPAPAPPPREQTWQPPMDLPPPAWLPEDLLPEAYRSTPASAPAPSLAPQPDPAPVSQRPASSSLKSKPLHRSLVPLAAAIALIATAGFAACQYHVFSRKLPGPQPPADSFPKTSAPADPSPAPVSSGIEEIRRPVGL